VESWEGIHDVIKYVNELWRVLAVNGKFILISAAPKEIMGTLMVDQLQLHQCSDWNLCRYESVAISNDDAVYYYAIKKLGELPETAKELMSLAPSASSSRPGAGNRLEGLFERKIIIW
jgi:hypothetical protein